MLRSLPAVLAWHRRRYPLLRATDIYKLIHQGVCGPGHIITSAAKARRMLEEEMAALEARSPKVECRMPETGLEPIDPYNRLVRVNLRPFVRAAEVRRQHRQTGAAEAKAECRSQSDAQEWLAEAMVESARRVKGDPDQMKRRLAAAVRWCRVNLLGETDALKQLAASAAESGYPAVHHSSTYRRAYRPAYRVILRTCVRKG